MRTNLLLTLIAIAFVSFCRGAFASPGTDVPDFVGFSGSAEIGEVRAGYAFSSSFGITNAGGDAPSNSPVRLRYELVTFPADPFPIQLGRMSFPGSTTTTFSDAQVTGLRQFGQFVIDPQLLTPPADTPPGIYMLRVRIDPENTRTECDESNNVYVIEPVVELLPTPDLDFRPFPMITIPGDDVALGAGDTFNVTAWVRNEGDLVNIPPITADFYLLEPGDETLQFRASATFNPASYRLLGRAVSAAFPATAQTPFSPNDGHLPLTATFSLPDDLDVLRYKIGVHLDPDGEIAERPNERSNGTLNRGASIDTEEITVIYVRDRPDYAYGGLASTSVSPTTFSSGDVVEFSGRIENLTSFSTTAATVVRHYLTPVGYDAEIHLGISLIPPIEQGAPYDFTVPFQIPVAGFTGEHTYRFEIDSVDVISETDETNNIGLGEFGALTITSPTRPDIVANPAGGTFTPTSRKAGETLEIDVDLINQGNSPTGAYHTRFVISRNANLRDADDIILATNLLINHPAGATLTLNPTVTLPGSASLPPGTYHIGWITDVNHAVLEVDETNNGAIATSMLTIVPPDPILYPDLTPKEIGLTEKIYVPTEALQLKVFVGNIGKAPAEKSSDLSMFLSTDLVAGNADDIPLATQRITTTIASETTAEVDIATNLPPAASLATGPYYLVAVADSTGVVDESSETNNDVVFVSRPIIVRQKFDVDLPVLNISAAGATPSNLLPGATISTFATVENDSANEATSVVTELVLSSDDEIGNADDLSLATFGPVFFKAFKQISYTDDIDLPSTLAPGTYTLAWIVDPDGLIAEVEKRDNVATMQITIREPLLQMIVINPDPDPEELTLALEDTLFGFTYRIQFSTDLTAGSWQNAGPIVAGNPNTLIFFGFDAPLGQVPVAPRVYFRAVPSPTG